MSYQSADSQSEGQARTSKASSYSTSITMPYYTTSATTIVTIVAIDKHKQQLSSMPSTLPSTTTMPLTSTDQVKNSSGSKPVLRPTY